jgi:ABC-2 type transport system permease protein
MDDTSRSENRLAPAAALPAPRVRYIGAVNWVGLWTLYAKEVQRFCKVFMQTLVAPMATSLLFLAIFSLALGRAVTTVVGMPFPVFLGPGLVMMAVMQGSFANTSSSMLISKVQGNIVDVLMPPMSAGELALAYGAAGATRGVMVAATSAAAVWAFVPLRVHDPLAVVFFLVAASMMLSLLGLIAGIWADKFDHIAAVTNFVILPLSFLSGTFYSIERLPGAWHTAAHFNPFFYMIDGFRYGFIGHADAPLWLGATVVSVITVGLWLIALAMFRTGYKLKS